MTDIKKFKDLLLEVPEITSAEHINSVPSAITTSWSEEIWTEDMIARDTLQNFYDGCIENKLPISPNLQAPSKLSTSACNTGSESEWPFSPSSKGILIPPK